MDKYIDAAASELRAAQARARLTDTALSKRAGIPVVTLRRYLKGERDTPVSALFRMAIALDITPGRLLDDAMRTITDDQPSNVIEGRFGSPAPTADVDDERAVASDSSLTREDDRSDEYFD